MSMRSSSYDLVGLLVAFFVAAIAIMATVLGIDSCANSRIAEVNERLAKADATEAAPARRASGCPLDAIEYDPPVAMGDCQRCLRFTDRLTGESWWILRTLDGYIVLPIENEAR